MCMIRADSRYGDAKGGSLEGYLCSQMKNELLACAGVKVRQAL